MIRKHSLSLQQKKVTKTQDCEWVKERVTYKRGSCLLNINKLSIDYFIFNKNIRVRKEVQISYGIHRGVSQN